MTSEAQTFPVFEVDEGPDPKVKVSTGIEMWLADPRQGISVLMRPTRVTIRGLTVTWDAIGEEDDDDQR